MNEAEWNSDQAFGERALREMQERDNKAKEIGLAVLAVLNRVEPGGPTWRVSGGDTAYASPFGTIRVCRACGCLVAGGPTACGRCAAATVAKPDKP